MGTHVKALPLTHLLNFCIVLKEQILCKCVSKPSGANKRLYALGTLKKSGLTIMQLVQVYCGIVPSVIEYAFPVWAALPKYLNGATESVQKRALHIVLPNCHYDDALIQSGITALSQSWEEACTNSIKHDCMSSSVLKPLIPSGSIDRPYCLRLGKHARYALSPRQSGSQISALLYRH